MAQSESVISKFHAKVNTSKIPAYFKVKDKGDKKGHKALRNEQGLRCHKWEGRQSSESGLSVAWFTFRARFLFFKIPWYVHCDPCSITVGGGNFEVSMIAYAVMRRERHMFAYLTMTTNSFACAFFNFCL